LTATTLQCPDTRALSIPLLLITLQNPKKKSPPRRNDVKDAANGVFGGKGFPCLSLVVGIVSNALTFRLCDEEATSFAVAESLGSLIVAGVVLVKFTG
jgi:hypothetical protein